MPPEMAHSSNDRDDCSIQLKAEKQKRNSRQTS